MDNEDDEFSEPELPVQINHPELMPRPRDVERGLQRDELNPVETNRSEDPMPAKEMESEFRTWRIDNNPFRGADNVYFPNQQMYGGR